MASAIAGARSFTPPNSSHSTCISELLKGSYRRRVRSGAVGQQQSLEVFLQATASGCMSGLSLNGRLDGAARYTEGTLQQSFVSASDRPMVVIGASAANACFATLAAAHGRRANYQPSPHASIRAPRKSLLQ